MTVTGRRCWSQKHSISFRGPREGSPNPMGERILKSLRKKVRKQQKKKGCGEACDPGEMHGQLYLLEPHTADFSNPGLLPLALSYWCLEESTTLPGKALGEKSGDLGSSLCLDDNLTSHVSVSTCWGSGMGARRGWTS